MENGLRCESCGRQGLTQYGQFRQGVGLLVAMQVRTYAGHFCPRYAKRLYRKTMVVNLRLGLCSIMSLFFIPFAVIGNMYTMLSDGGDSGWGAPAAPSAALVTSSSSMRRS